MTIYMCGLDGTGPEKLTAGVSVGKFASEVLPGVLAGMQQEFGWANAPKVVVHDKASYFVSRPALQRDFALGLRDGGLRSWLGGPEADAGWLAARLGDFFPHETLISHIRRLLSHVFVTNRLGETLVQFRRRLDLVEDHLNSGAWSKSPDALLRLAKSYRCRAQEIKDRKGDRIPK